MDYVILSAVSGLIALLLCEHLSIVPRRKELEDLKRRNEDDLRELYNLRGQNAYLSEELEQLKAKNEDDLRKLREENDGLTSEVAELKSDNCLMVILLQASQKAFGEKNEEIKEIRQQKEALEKELLEKSNEKMKTPNE